MAIHLGKSMAFWPKRGCASKRAHFPLFFYAFSTDTSILFTRAWAQQLAIIEGDNPLDRTYDPTAEEEEEEE
jgi:hypothetical protein